VARGTDDEVVERAKRGDADAWRALYRDHAGRLLVWIGTRPTSDTAVAAEDLAAETWLTAAEKIHSFNGTSSEFAGWLFGIARKLSGNVYRRSRRRNTQPDDMATLVDLAAVPGPESAYAGQDWVTRVLSLLPPRERDVVACREVVGLDVEATAAALGISAVSVRVAHHRGLKRLSAQLASSERSPAR
jgi:RNA polymerase sigma-70 factor (ECF subfamily)